MLVGLIVIACSSAHAGEFANVKDQIATARQALVTMILHRDKRGPEQQKLVQETANIVSVHLATMKVPTGKAAEFKELRDTWAAFKKTREKELVPAILAGDSGTYERIGAGIQKERLDRMYVLTALLDK